MIPEVDLDDFRPLCSVPGHGTEALAHLHDSEEATHYITTNCPHCGKVDMVHMACLTAVSMLEISLCSGVEQYYQCGKCSKWGTSSEMQFSIGRI